MMPKSVQEPSRLFVGKTLEVLKWSISGAEDTIVLIHEALGSAGYWKNFPALLAESTCVNVLAYSRAGHGESDGPLEPRSDEYYHRQVEEVLPALLEEHRIVSPILYGHSEGAAIAFLYAAAGCPVKAIIAESPIVLPGKDTLQTVEEMNNGLRRAELIDKLGRYHRNAGSVFDSWVEGVRSHLAARTFSAAEYLPRIACPVLVIEGALDPFSGQAQQAVLKTGIRHLRTIVLENTGHLPHREQPQMVLECVRGFLTEPLEAQREALVRHNC